MLCGRRLPLPQPPLPGWSTKAASVRYLSSTAPRADNNAPNQNPLEAQVHYQLQQGTQDEKHGQEQIGNPSRNTARIHDQPPREAFTARTGHREYTNPPGRTFQEGQEFVQPQRKSFFFHKYDPVAKKNAIADQARKVTAKPFSKHLFLNFEGRRPFQPPTHLQNSQHAGQYTDPVFPILKNEIKGPWMDQWKHPVANQVGLAKSTGVEPPIPPPSKLKPLAKPISPTEVAIRRQVKLQTEGKSPLYRPRPRTLMPMPKSVEYPPKRPEGPMLMNDGSIVGKGSGRFFSRPFGATRDDMFRVISTSPPSVSEEAADAASHLQSPEDDGIRLEQKEAGPMPLGDTQEKTTDLGEEAESNQSIFERLFPEPKKPTTASRSSMIGRLRSLAAELDGDLHPSSQTDAFMPAFSPQSSQPTGSIFRKLFPEEAGPEPGPEPDKVQHENGSQASDSLEDTIFVSLRNEVRNWVPPDRLHEINAPKQGDYGSHSTVIVIWGVSNSLVDTDFYRIIPEGKHVEGWGGGLMKIVQARDLLTHKPLGRYFLMFHSRPSAVAYAEQANRLYLLSRKLLHPSGTGRQPVRGRLEQAQADPQPFLTEEEKIAVRSFTLCPPSAPFNISVRMWGTEVIGQITASGNIADVVQALRPEAETPAKVLVTIKSPDGSAEGGKRLGGLSINDLWLILRDDGRERSAPWVLTNLTEGIMPIKLRLTKSERREIRFQADLLAALPNESEIGHEDVPGLPIVAGHPLREDNKGGSGTDVDRDERFDRFILTFAHLTMARRFVRCWHKRMVHDAVLDRSVVIDAVALM